MPRCIINLTLCTYETQYSGTIQRHLEHKQSTDSMGFKLILLLTLVTLLVAFVIDTLIRFHFFTRMYDHFPGNCTKFELNGSEDFALFPNDHVLVSSGLELWRNKRVPPSISVIDLQDPNPRPIELTIEGNFLTEISPTFNPHGVGHWVTDDAEYLFYVVNHRPNLNDTIESFLYLPDSKSLRYRKTITCPECYNFNDLALVGKDELYVTRDHYYKHTTVKVLEVYMRFSFGSVLYIDGRGETAVVKVAADDFWYSNGIARSNDGRLLYVNECGSGTVTALVRNNDNTLKKVQTLYLQPAPDNLFVSPVNGHLWVAFIAKPFQFEEYKDAPNPSSVPVGGRILHIAIDEKSEQPFDGHKVEEVFSTSGELIGGTSGAVFHNKKLLVGTVRTGMMVCDVPYVMYE